MNLKVINKDLRYKSLPEKHGFLPLKHEFRVLLVHNMLKKASRVWTEEYKKYSRVI